MKRLLLSSLIGACVIMGIAGCGPQQNGMTHEAIYASLDDKMKAALERSNDPKEIDKEFLLKAIKSLLLISLVKL